MADKNCLPSGFVIVPKIWTFGSCLVSMHAMPTTLTQSRIRAARCERDECRFMSVAATVRFLSEYSTGKC